RRRHTRFSRDWSSDVCSSDLGLAGLVAAGGVQGYGLRLLGAGLQHHADAAGGAGVGLQGGQDAAGQAAAAHGLDHVHPLQFGVAVPVALAVGVLHAPAAGGDGDVPVVVDDQVDAVRGCEVRRVHGGGVAAVAVAEVVFGLYLGVQLHGVGVVVGD